MIEGGDDRPPGADRFLSRVDVRGYLGALALCAVATLAALLLDRWLERSTS